MLPFKMLLDHSKSYRVHDYVMYMISWFIHFTKIFFSFFHLPFLSPFQIILMCTSLKLPSCPFTHARVHRWWTLGINKKLYADCAVYIFKGTIVVLDNCVSALLVTLDFKQLRTAHFWIFCFLLILFEYFVIKLGT